MTHLAVSIARALYPKKAVGPVLQRRRLVNKLDAEARAERQGRTADLISRLDFLILDELDYLPFAQTGGQLCSTPDQQALRADFHHRHDQISPLANGPPSSATPKRTTALLDRLTTTARSSKPATKAGASRTEHSANKPPRPAAAALHEDYAAPGQLIRRGQNWTPIGGHDWMPIEHGRIAGQQFRIVQDLHRSEAS